MAKPNLDKAWGIMPFAHVNGTSDWWVLSKNREVIRIFLNKREAFDYALAHNYEHNVYAVFIFGECAKRGAWSNERPDALAPAPAPVEVEDEEEVSPWWKRTRIAEALKKFFAVESGALRRWPRERNDNKTHRRIRNFKKREDLRCELGEKPCDHKGGIPTRGGGIFDSLQL
jgi:hypothetical protein